MKKNVMKFVTVASVWLLYFSINSCNVRASTYENKSVVRFYSDSDIDTSQEPDEQLNIDSDSETVLPQTGSTVSYMRASGFSILMLIGWITWKKKNSRN